MSATHIDDNPTASPVTISMEDVARALQRSHLQYDRNGEMHCNDALTHLIPFHSIHSYPSSTTSL
jgi:hypothetical protein